MLNERAGLQDPTPPGAGLAEKIRLRRDAARNYFAALPDVDAVRNAMETMNLAWGAVRDSADIEESLTVAHRGVITTVDDGGGGRRQVTQSPYHFSNAESGVRNGAPHRGEHNEQVLRDWLQLDDSEVASWLHSGVLLDDVGV